MRAEELNELQAIIRDVPDFPSPGILFKDITPLLRDSRAFGLAVSGLAELAEDVDYIAGVEARGFIFGAAIAQKTGKGFIPIRKSGKLPAASYSDSYSLEYGESTLQIHQDALHPGERVMIIDDVLATGGTLASAIRLVERCGAVVGSLAVLMEIVGLEGKSNLANQFPQVSLSILINE